MLTCEGENSNEKASVNELKLIFSFHTFPLHADRCDLSKMPSEGSLDV